MWCAWCFDFRMLTEFIYLGLVVLLLYVRPVHSRTKHITFLAILLYYKIPFDSIII